MTTEQSLLTDTQFAAILAALVAFGGGLITLLRWGIGLLRMGGERIVKALDENTAKSEKQTEAFIELRSKVDEVHDLVIDRPPRSRASTPALGSSGRGRPLTEDPQRGSVTVRLAAILAGATLTVGLIFAVAVACHNDPVGPIPIDAACPLKALTHPCAALPCLSIEDCTIAMPGDPSRCTCLLDVSNPPFPAECYGPVLLRGPVL